jgi:two-component system, NarL family, response regulator NreC
VLSVMVVDDHPIVRQGVRGLLEAETDVRVIGEAGDGLEAAQMIERLKPDVVVVDLMMPGLNGIDMTRQVSQRSPSTRVLILSMHSSEAYVLAALRGGAAGYFLKRCLSSDLVHAVREVAAGRRYLSPPLSDRAIQAYVERSDEAPADPYDSLSVREREVLHLAAEGHTNAQVAARLFISPRTAEHHRENLMHKLQLKNTTELIRYALKRGILSLDE